jgi:hypothetical protein
MASQPYTHPEHSGARLPGWLAALLVGIFALTVAGIIVALVIMLPRLGLDENEEFLWRRQLEDPPVWAPVVPVLFALATLLLVVLFRREGRWQALLVALVVIAALSVVYVPLALLLRLMFAWMIVLVPMLAIALFYAGMMYLRDARSIHPVWAAFLGFLRCAVYTILAVVFLLPGCQAFEQNVSYPKVMFVFDVSGSMTTRDDTPNPGQPVSALPTRQDKVIAFLTSDRDLRKEPQTPFLDRVLGNTDLVMYRFGSKLDEKEVQRIKQAEQVHVDRLTRWLKPNKADIVLPADLPEDKRGQAKLDLEDLYDQLVAGTNIPGSANAALKLENNSYLQAIIVISDGNNNAGSDEALIELLARVNDQRRNVPVFTVGVGEFRQPIGIQIEDILAPEVARPDDKFAVRVPVIGTGLNDQEFSVTLEATRIPLDASGKPLPRDKTFTLGPKAGKFKGAGDHPSGTVEFEINVQDLKQIKAANDPNGLLEGEWEFVAKVGKHALEVFDKDEHVSDPVKVLVQKKELRILLFAGGATQEYKFVRTLLFREQLQKRVKMSIMLQSAIVDGRVVDYVDQDVDPKENPLLEHFPNYRGEPKPGEKQYCFNSYDAIIAIDPDWSQLRKEELRLFGEWVNKDAGGVVFVAGPVNTYQLFRPGGRGDDFKPLATMYPVLPKDSRLHVIGQGVIEGSHDSSRPYVLHFSPKAKDYDFLKLDEKSEEPIAGWDRFFWGNATPEPGKQPARGFFNFYPVEKLKPDSAVIATFGGPAGTYFVDADGKKQEQPFIVGLRYGAGKTVYLGSGEFWRMRPIEGYHERFWIKLARYVAAGATMQKKYGLMLLPRVASVGTVNFEAKLRDSRQEPLAADSHPVVLVRKLDGDADGKADKTELKPRQVDDARDWEGEFLGAVKIREAGKYEFKIPIPGTPESLHQELIVRKPNPEMDNVRNNFEYLYQLASESDRVLENLPVDVRKEVKSKLKAPQAADAAKSRLFFTLHNADTIAKCLRQIDPQREKIKGPLNDLWDKGVGTGLYINAYYLAWGVPVAVGVLGFAILLFLRQTLFAALFLAGSWLLGLIVAAGGLFWSDWPDLPIDFSFVLVMIVSLLCVEWLTRKLLKLA